MIRRTRTTTSLEVQPTGLSTQMSPFQSDGSSGPLRTPAALASLDEDRTTHVESAPRGAFGTASLRKGLPKLPQSARSISGRALRASIESVEAFFLWPYQQRGVMNLLQRSMINVQQDSFAIYAHLRYVVTPMGPPNSERSPRSRLHPVGHLRQRDLRTTRRPPPSLLLLRTSLHQSGTAHRGLRAPSILGSDRTVLPGRPCTARRIGEACSPCLPA
mmetsp:Transcript_14075/g.52824  ORF Transcript_14075/g.52824 Transcript_14075/m.52824 type:complete len:217 (-) Transcript_14075:528-1178(-)